MQRMEALRTRCFHTNILKECGEIIRAGKVDPEMNSIDFHDALLMRMHEHQRVPPVLVSRDG